MTTLNELNDAWVAAGQKVSDLQNKASAMVNADDVTVEDVTKAKNDVKTAQAQRDLAYQNLVDARAEEVAAMDNKDVQPLNNDEKAEKNKFIDEFKGMMKNDPTIINSLTSSTDEQGNAAGLTIPVDVQTAIHQLMRQYDSLEQYVNHEAVTTTSGSRVYEKFSDITPLANLDDEEGEIKDQDAPKLTLIKYAIKRYAGINTVTNSLLKDTADNILQWLTTWIARKVVVTRNQAIIEKMNVVPTKPTLNKFDDIKDLQNKTLDPALLSTSMFITNQSGFAELAKVKDAHGEYLIQSVVSQPEIKQIGGKQIVVVGDRWLPNPAKDTFPLYFGDMTQAITLYDREHMSLLSTNIGGGAFEHDQTKVRVIDRFDVETTDSEAMAAASFKKIEDQKSTTGVVPTA
ncbi:phage major capsid protein [Weissella viridescens]|uniref:phage major capsid protein n=1 Tax=Weissella viridescens TaxID=1629 RepID=UPI003AF1EB59